MQCCCYFPLIVLYMLWGEAMVPSGFKSCSEPCAVTLLSLVRSLSFSHTENGRRHAGSQHGGGVMTQEREGGGCVSHLISVPMETDGWRIPLPLTCNLWRLGQRLVALPAYCTCHAQTFQPQQHLCCPRVWHSSRKVVERNLPSELFYVCSCSVGSNLL